jgi:hypothetical protein
MTRERIRKCIDLLEVVGCIRKTGEKRDGQDVYVSVRRPTAEDHAIMDALDAAPEQRS